MIINLSFRSLYLSVKRGGIKVIYLAQVVALSHKMGQGFLLCGICRVRLNKTSTGLIRNYPYFLCEPFDLLLHPHEEGAAGVARPGETLLKLPRRLRNLLEEGVADPHHVLLGPWILMALPCMHGESNKAKF